MQVWLPRSFKGRLLLTDTQRLGNLCLRILSVPPGIVSVERSFSLLRDLDTKQRNRMKDSTLREAFFLRANAFLFSAPPLFQTPRRLLCRFHRYRCLWRRYLFIAMGNAWADMSWQCS
jgi:hypothetical protein